MRLPGGAVGMVRAAGWLTVGLAAVASVMPWGVGVVGTAGVGTEQRLTSALFCMAIVQLAMSRLIPQTNRRVAWLLSTGALSYAAGVLLGSSGAAWLMAVGTVAVLSGTALVWLEPVTDWNGHERRILGGLLFAGVALDGVLALGTLRPESAVGLYMGPAEGLRFRLLALARVAAMTLPALTLLYQQAARQRVLSASSICWVCLALHGGAVLMPGVLVLAAVVEPLWKYLLPVPALLIFVGVCGAAQLARRRGLRLEQLGWVLMALSMAVGLAMGLYAFDGPLPSPGWVGKYGDVVRSSLRQTHGLAIVAGILLVFLARDRPARSRGGH